MERSSERGIMHDDFEENTPWREGEDRDRALGEGPFDEEEFDPEEAERHITRFIRSAEELPGPPVAEIAEQVAALMREVSMDLEEILADKAHNKVLATQLLLGQRARGLRPDDPEQWRLHASTTLLSVMVVRGSRE